MKRLAITYILLLLTFVAFGTMTKVTRIIDGDTFEIETGEKVRLIGINAPEISDIFGQEAKQYLSDLIENKTVDLQIDNISNNRDRYQRLLRYVILNGFDINKKMVLDGFAFAYLKYHFEKSNEYKDAQIFATQNNLGMWGNQKKDKVVKQQENKETILHSLSLRKLFIISLMAILLMVGFYYYFKRN